MKRRQFIKRSAATAIAFTMPWGKLKAQIPEKCQSIFQEFKWVNDNKDSYKFNMSLCKDGVTAFAAAGAENKIIKVLITQNIKNAQNSYDIKEYRADLKIRSVKRTAENADVYKVETDFLQENKNEYELPKEINIRKLSFIFHSKADISSIDVLDKKGNIYLTIAEKPPVDADEEGEDDCFITTACVLTLGKTDDCEELTLLRHFRDHTLKADAAGLKLINEYYHIAPAIVQAIAGEENKEDIYKEIYLKMLIPTMNHITNKEDQEAIEIYRNYTLKLKEIYL